MLHFESFILCEPASLSNVSVDLLCPHLFPCSTQLLEDCTFDSEPWSYRCVSQLDLSQHSSLHNGTPYGADGGNEMNCRKFERTSSDVTAGYCSHCSYKWAIFSLRCICHSTAKNEATISRPDLVHTCLYKWAILCFVAVFSIVIRILDAANREKML